MGEDTFVGKAFEVWQKDSQQAVAGEHLEEDVLYRLACPGGLGSGSEQEIVHLTMCAKCRQEWQRWQESIVIVEDEEELEPLDVVLSGGMLKAASASLFSEPVSLTSGCGKFELSLFPDLDMPDKAMVVIEVVQEQAGFEGRYCVVKDGKGAVLLKGVIEDDRCAGRVDSLSVLDLKTWTVQVNPV